MKVSPYLRGATSVMRNCEVCDSEFRVFPSELRKGPRRFCSIVCRSRAFEGSGNPKWKGGQTRTAHGYVLVQAPDHPQADRHGYYEEHRLVMERHLGRLLTTEECVHHKNRVRDDNRIENLELMASWAEHQRLHLAERARA